MQIAIVGCPNSGKSSIFNRLTGNSQRIANYPGVTVSIEKGHLRTSKGSKVQGNPLVMDAPGCYSLAGHTDEQKLVSQMLKGEPPFSAPPDLLVVVIDVCQLADQLPLAMELRSGGIPMIVALNQWDIAQRRGMKIDAELLSRRIGAPCILTTGIRKSGMRDLLEKIEMQIFTIANRTQTIPTVDRSSELGVQEIIAEAVSDEIRPDSLSQRLDRFLLHPVLGPVIMLGMLFFLFQAVFSWSGPPSEWIAGQVDALAAWLATVLPPSGWSGVLTQGILPGIGVVLEFLPPILLLSFFLLLLDGSGYISRIAFLCDALLARIGIGGHTVFPFLSGFSCAIPALTAVRSIPDSNLRLASIMAIPLIPCSARLPVYTLVISVVIGDGQFLGFSIKGWTLFAFYLFGLAVSLLVTMLISIYRGSNASAPLELPAWRLPALNNIIQGLRLRTRHFLQRAGTIILACSIALWWLAQVPVNNGYDGVAGSLLGWIGIHLYPLFAPLGFTLEMTIALIPGLLAREVAVAALATVHAVENSTGTLAATLAESWSLAAGLSFAVWYIFAPQCIATMSVIRSETGSWVRVFQAMGYLFALAWIAAFITYRLFS